MSAGANGATRPLTRRGFVKGATAAAITPWVVTTRPSPSGSPWRIPRVEPQDVPLYDLEVWQAADLIRRRIVSPVELAEATLQRIADTEPRIETFVNKYPDDEIMAQAEAAEDEIAAGQVPGAASWDHRRDQGHLPHRGQGDGRQLRPIRGIRSPVRRDVPWRGSRTPAR